MFVVFEISKPFKIKPGSFRSEITIFRVWWLWFALSLHPGRYDEMIDMSNSGVVVWNHPFTFGIAPCILSSRISREEEEQG